LEQRARILAVKGNLGEVQFGWGKVAFDAQVAFLAANANSLFVHCGATVPPLNVHTSCHPLLGTSVERPSQPR
jgi:hypothetical protein